MIRRLVIQSTLNGGELTTWWTMRRWTQMASILGWQQVEWQYGNADRLHLSNDNHCLRLLLPPDADPLEGWQRLKEVSGTSLRPYLRPATAEDPLGPSLRFEVEPSPVPWMWHCRKPWQLPEERLRELMTLRGWTLATAESCTGGMLAHRITSVSGSSAYFQGSVVAYANAVKEHLLKVPSAMLARHGAVSEPVARQMVEGIQDILSADVALSTTGIAGPTGGSLQKPVGTVWIGMSTPSIGTMVVRFQGIGNRTDIIEQASTAALLMLLAHLESIIAS